MEHIVNKKVLPDTKYHGFKFRIREDYHDDKIIREIFSTNHYRVPPTMNTVIDVGANIGTMSLLCAREGAEVYAYEPEDFNFETLTHNVKINGYEDRIHCIHKGIGKPGTARLYISETNSGGTSTHFSANAYLNSSLYQSAELISIREALKDIEYCDLLKLDCEGSEYEIIMDLDDELASKIGQISVEFHNWRLIDKQVEKLKKWFNAELIHRKIWVFTK